MIQFTVLYVDYFLLARIAHVVKHHGQKKELGHGTR